MTEERRGLLLEFEGNIRKYMEDQRRAKSRLSSDGIKSHFLRGGRNLSIVDEKRPDESLQKIEKRELLGWHEGCSGKALGGDVYDKRYIVHSGWNLYVVDGCIAFRIG
jgi:hypothetical protein